MSFESGRSIYWRLISTPTNFQHGSEKMQTQFCSSNPLLGVHVAGRERFQMVLFNAACLFICASICSNTAYAEGSIIELAGIEEPDHGPFIIERAEPSYISRGPFVIQRAGSPLIIYIERSVPNTPKTKTHIEIPFILIVEPAGQTACHVKATTKVYQAPGVVTEIEINSGETSIQVELVVTIDDLKGAIELHDELSLWLKGSEPEETEEIDLKKGRALKIDLGEVKRLERCVVTQLDVQPRPIAEVNKLSIDERIRYFYSLFPDEAKDKKPLTKTKP